MEPTNKLRGPRYPNRMVSVSALDDRGIIGQFDEDHYELTATEASLMVTALTNYSCDDDEVATIAGLIDMFRAREGQRRSMKLIRTTEDG